LNVKTVTKANGTENSAEIFKTFFGKTRFNATTVSKNGGRIMAEKTKLVVPSTLFSL